MAKMCNSILKRKEEGGVKNDKKSQTCDQRKKIFSPTTHSIVQRQVFARSKASRLVSFVP